MSFRANNFITAKSPGGSVLLTKWPALQFYLISQAASLASRASLQYCTVLPPGCSTDSKPTETLKKALHIAPLQALLLPGHFAHLSWVKLCALQKGLGGRQWQNCVCCSKLDPNSGKNHCMSASKGWKPHATFSGTKKSCKFQPKKCAIRGRRRAKCFFTPRSKYPVQMAGPQQRSRSLFPPPTDFCFLGERIPVPPGRGCEWALLLPCD